MDSQVIRLRVAAACARQAGVPEAAIPLAALFNQALVSEFSLRYRASVWTAEVRAARSGEHHLHNVRAFSDNPLDALSLLAVALDQQIYPDQQTGDL